MDFDDELSTRSESPFAKRSIKHEQENPKSGNSFCILPNEGLGWNTEWKTGTDLTKPALGRNFAISGAKFFGDVRQSSKSRSRAQFPINC